MTLNGCILAVFLLGVFCVSGILGAGGNTGCLATPIVYGPVCRSSTSIIGSPGAKISYSISFSGNTLLCCKAFYCPKSGCGLNSIGCSSSGSLKTGSLQWGNNIARPKVQCYGSILGTPYSFRH